MGLGILKDGIIDYMFHDEPISLNSVKKGDIHIIHVNT